ncbi:PH domain-containing protein [Elizabethkingia meningoseptica]|uniref:PH domain-containing protein n=1 Tax=Elizabethkingia TaxID=308865 RepID=UPI0023AF7BC3|nr:PH domain-containing protein [Elizabethkingia meningoseptica]MDE5509413.1 PH domain-containing protein [Elizabethkingia meningoseptica]HAY3534663.1 PH domain-containing protein [Elizabethkingia anophelis]HAY3546779.1 PH domain-containing protein [Elizabethkingia anophelis]
MENLLIVQKQNTEIPKDIIYSGKIHWMSYFIPVIQSFLGVIGLLSFIVTIGFFKLISLGLTVLLYKGVVKMLQLKFTKIYITKKYLTITTGIINKSTVDISLYRVEGTKVYQSIMGRIFNYGRVYVSTGEITKSFVIANPKEFKDNISK